MTKNLPEDGASWGVHTQAGRDISRDDQSPSSNPTQTEDWVMVDPRLIEEAISGLKAHTGSATEETQTRLRAMLKAAPIPSSLKGSDVGEVGE
jgi:hypothetical protein